MRPHWFAGQPLESIELGGMPGHWDSTWNDPQNQDQWFCAILPQAILGPSQLAWHIKVWCHFQSRHSCSKLWVSPPFWVLVNGVTVRFPLRHHEIPPVLNRPWAMQVRLSLDITMVNYSKIHHQWGYNDYSYGTAWLYNIIQPLISGTVPQAVLLAEVLPANPRCPRPGPPAMAPAPCHAWKNSTAYCSRPSGRFWQHLGTAIFHRFPVAEAGWLPSGNLT